MAAFRIPALENQRTCLRAALLVLLALSPLPFGSVQPWAVLTLEIYAAFLGVLALLTLLRDPEGLASRAYWPLLVAAMLVTVGVVQLIPVPTFAIDWFAGPNMGTRERLTVLLPEAAMLVPQSMQPPATLDALLRLVAYGLIGLSAAVAIRNTAHLGQAALVVAVAGAFQALYGSAEYLSGHQHIFAYAKKFSEEASGTFVNRNHFAGYLAMALPLALGPVLDFARRPVPKKWRLRLLSLAEPEGILALAGGVSAALIWIGVLLSYSRGGLAASMIAVGFVTIVRTKRAYFWIAILVIPTTFLLWSETRAPGERLFSAAQSAKALDTRGPVWIATLQMLPKYPMGTGLGTFEDAFNLNRPAEVRHRWDHAHNDWLQSASEGGLLVPAVLVGLLGLVFANTWYRQQLTILPGCVLAALMAIAVHSAVDFCLRIPAIATLAVFLIGASCATRTTES